MNTTDTSTNNGPKKPKWLRIKAPCSTKVQAMKELLQQHQLHTVCENAACPNIAECFEHGTATFLIMGNICTRNCAFCNIQHGNPLPLMPKEPENIAQVIKKMQLKHVVITSVTRDDLVDGGAAHFVTCIQVIRNIVANIKIEILVPDFQHSIDNAFIAFQTSQPDIFNHNLETVPRLYPTIRRGANYSKSLTLLKNFKLNYPQVITKSGLMLGLGETKEEIMAVMQDLRAHHCDMLTLGQYLQPKNTNIPVAAYLSEAEFRALADYGKNLGFKNVASGPLVRSSYHADLQAKKL